MSITILDYHVVSCLCLPVKLLTTPIMESPSRLNKFACGYSRPKNLFFDTLKGMHVDDAERHAC